MSNTATNAARLKIEKFGPNLVFVLLNLIQEIADYCSTKQFDLSEVSAFSSKSDEWPRALLSIYESLYTLDC
jgi:hypothetical protein